MRVTDVWPGGCVLLLCAMLVGCATQHVIVVSDAAAPPLPLLLQGQNTRLRLAFPQKDQTVQPGSLQRNEVCYLKAGDFRVDCYTDGSSLNLGPNDSTALLSDNPMWDIAPVDSDKAAGKYLRLYGVLFLVGSSIDRLPQTLSDYLQDPGSHQVEAVALARMLLTSRRVQLQGYARGGGFTVLMELTDAGQDKLVDALDQAGETTGTTQLVSSRRTHPSPPHQDRHICR